MTGSTKNEKTVLVDHEEKTSLVNAAEFLETMAKKLREEGTFTLTHNGQTHEVTPASSVVLEIKLEKQLDKNKLEVELEWRDGDNEKDAGISIS
ncbi:amphi-Trp domain-containing protein [Sporosarcina sp. P33]|uniref:amphi-Trp domain-containing protein n=1 Tax=Sporosarcina sp. P33 TaxID=1930764 RepID=UPI0009BCA12E|nr:amphi-Trp domain-containing protein [Sporosarcina sp. P33]ARD47897.1 hypothetical protein SporoP33_06435 [Sporosarcina sp. P33]